MGLETGTFIDSLVATNPVGATDPKSQGDDHLRLIKSTILATFPNLTGAMTLTEVVINNLADAAIKDEANSFTAAQTLATGVALILQDSTDTDSISISHDGTDVDVAFVGTTAIRFRDGVSLRVQDSTDANYIAIAHDGTNGRIDLDAAAEIIFGSNVSQLAISNGFLETKRDNSASTRGHYLMKDHADITQWQLQMNTSDSLLIADQGGDVQLTIGQSGIIVTPNLVAAEIGYKGAPQVIDNTSRAIILTDAGKQIYKASGGAGETMTIPANASVAFPIGTIIEIINDGGGDLSIAITTDTLEKFGGATGTQTLTDNNKAIIEKVTSTLWKYSSTD